MMAFLYVFIGGGLGSLLRYGISLLTVKFWSTQFPTATLISNLLACALLGFLVYIVQIKQSDSSPWLNQLLIVGFCGGFSTFSAFSLETLELMNRGNLAYAALNILLSIVLGVGILFLLKLGK